MSRINILFTLTGKDKVGIVDDVTQQIVALGGNVEASRMARLGGEFAMLMLISLPAEQSANLEKCVAGLTARGFRVIANPTQNTDELHSDWQVYRIEVFGADHEGIIHEIAHSISQFGINIESMDSETTPAPNSGAPLFNMIARVIAPPKLRDETWAASLKEAGRKMNVEVSISAE
jgi:glycine cleavage system transcriptional repressor